jgi:penicillin-insensitive murein endopeptidase
VPQRMGSVVSLAVLLATLSVAPRASLAGPLVNPWAQARGPAAGSVRVIGGYAGGCIQGAVSLLPDAGSFELMRQSRHRYFAHPEMRAFVHWLAAQVQRRGYGTLLVGDLAQPRGGPTTTGHASHQIGLDGDFWFWLHSPAAHRRLSQREREELSAPSMLNAARSALDLARFHERQLRVLELAAKRPEVERIFVNPFIKKYLCRVTGEAAWLHKLRPWWGHREHFHVRLACPRDQHGCKVQEPPDPGPGCGAELDWWLSPAAQRKAREIEQASRTLSPEQRLAARLARVPKECSVVLHRGT